MKTKEQRKEEARKKCAKIQHAAWKKCIEECAEIDNEPEKKCSKCGQELK